MEKQFSAIASEHYRFLSALHSQFFAPALAASFVHLSLPFRLAIKIFYKRMYHKTEKSTEKEGKRENKISLMATQIFCLLFFSSIIFFPLRYFFPPFGFLFCLPTFLDLHKISFFCRVEK